MVATSSGLQGALLADGLAPGADKNGGGHIGFHEARCNVYKDVMRGEGLGQRLAHGVEGGLTCRVGRRFRRSSKGASRRDLHHLPSSAFRHMPGGPEPRIGRAV